MFYFLQTNICHSCRNYNLLLKILEMSEIPYDNRTHKKWTATCTLEYDDKVEYKDESYTVEVRNTSTNFYFDLFIYTDIYVYP